MNFHHSCENFIGKLVIGKCIMSIFKKGVDPDWGRYTPLHLKSNPVPNPLLLKEWSVANPLHSLHWIGLWSGVSRSEPVSDNCATNYVVSHFKTIEKVVLLLSNHHYQHRDFKFCFMVTLSIIGSWAA